MMTTQYTEEQALAIGGRPWASNPDRIYINTFAEAMGLEVDRYRTGNISHAELHGEKIANAQAQRIVDSKVWIEGGELHIRTASRYEDEIRAAVEALLDGAK